MVSRKWSLDGTKRANSRTIGTGSRPLKSEFKTGVLRGSAAYGIETECFPDQVNTCVKRSRHKSGLESQLWWNYISNRSNRQINSGVLSDSGVSARISLRKICHSEERKSGEKNLKTWQRSDADSFRGAHCRGRGYACPEKPKSQETRIRVHPDSFSAWLKAGLLVLLPASCG